VEIADRFHGTGPEGSAKADRAREPMRPMPCRAGRAALSIAIGRTRRFERRTCGSGPDHLTSDEGPLPTGCAVQDHERGASGHLFAASAADKVAAEG